MSCTGAGLASLTNTHVHTNDPCASIHVHPSLTMRTTLRRESLQAFSLPLGATNTRASAPASPVCAHPDALHPTGAHYGGAGLHSAAQGTQFLTCSDLKIRIGASCQEHFDGEEASLFVTPVIVLCSTVQGGGTAEAVLRVHLWCGEMPSAHVRQNRLMGA